MPLTSEQLLILAESEASFRVLAGAGSGKTTTMSHFVKIAIEKRNIPSSAIGFVTFTRFAAKQIKMKTKEIIGYMTQMTCGTFHSTLFNLLKKSGHEVPASKNLFDARMEEGIEFTLDLMRNRDPHMVRILILFRIFIVDEFQDVDEIQFEFIKHLKSINPTVQIIAIGDLAQNIYRFRGTSNEFLRTLLKQDIDPDLKTFTLTTNFRSTRSILELANAMFEEDIRDGHILPMVPGPDAEQGIKPKYYEFAISPGSGTGEYEELVALELLKLIERAKKEQQSIVLIFPALKCASYHYITGFLREYSRGKDYAFDIHQIAKEDETCTTVEFTYDTRDKDAPIQTSSFHSSKGLEWDIVALINISDALYCIKDNEEDTEAFNAEKTNLSYVGVTRAMKELYMFANANTGGRHRRLAHLGDNLSKYVDYTQWGENPKEFNSPLLKPVGISNILRRLPQHPDLFERVRACTEHITSIGFDGGTMFYEDVYAAMKIRNREMAVGSFVDWKLKHILCSKGGKSIQQQLLELADAGGYRSLSKKDSMEPLDILAVKIEIFFRNSGIEDVLDYIQYSPTARFMAMNRSSRWGMTPSARKLYCDAEKVLMDAWKRVDRTLFDEYMISQARAFYLSGHLQEIQAIVAPKQQYQGLPENFEEFCEKNLEFGKGVIYDLVKGRGGDPSQLEGDRALETDTFILGEADLYDPSGEGHLIEMKCSISHRATDLRDTGNCKNVLQVLAYVAMGRHGTIPLKCRWATLVNPLTGAHEIYDMASWTHEQSAEMLSCLEELRMRG
jgi:hypothetical protein